MPISLIILILVAAGGVATAALTVLLDARRRQALRHVAGGIGLADDAHHSVLLGTGRADQESLLASLITRLGSWWETDAETSSALVRAGYDSPRVALTFGAIRVASLIGLPLVTFLFFPMRAPFALLLAVSTAVIFAFIGPTFFLSYVERKRKVRLVRALPDVMDLLVLCVEAGLGFDAAVLRVGQELQNAHPDMASELLIVNRKVNAGVTREEAMRAAYVRTGVEELRVLVQHLVQSERLGTSIGKVLRVYAQTLRIKRKQTAEKKAALAPLKMTFPMAAFILPALFVMILGPAMLQVVNLFGGPRLGSGLPGATPIINP